MTAKSDVWMAFYVGSYVVNTLHLTRAQHGSYLMLIIAAFKNGGWLANNDATLTAIAKCSAKEWAAERAIYAAFFEVSPERWVHVFVEGQLDKAQRLTEQRRRAGVASAESRQRTRNTRSTGVDYSLQHPGRPSELHKQNLPVTSSRPVAEEVGSPAPGGARPLPDSAKWSKALDGYRPWEGVRNWPWDAGPIPDSPGGNPVIPRLQLEAWQGRAKIGWAEARAQEKAA